jgi:oxygen-independent coproporphyrinogen-3 oxidase
MEKMEHEGQAVNGEEKANSQKAAGEFMFLGLRMTQGISIDAFSRRFGTNPDEFYSQISDWIVEGLMENKDGHLKLTRRGLMVANSIFVNFV